MVFQSEHTLNNLEHDIDISAKKVILKLIDEFGEISNMASDTYFRGSPIVIDVEHHEIHCGDSLTSNISIDIPNSGSIDILIITPNSTIKRYHFLPKIFFESEIDYYLYEDCVVTNNGTTIDSRNRNRADPQVSETEVSFFHTPIVTNVGTELEHLHFAIDRGSGGEQRSTNEWILKNNSKYLIRVINSTTTNNYVTVKMNYYVQPGV
jgi:hypothetical protein